MAANASFEPTPSELAIAADNPAAPLAAVLARKARLARPAGVHPLWDDGANVSGPLFYGFVDWILRQAREKKITWVGFLARDGQLPHKIANLLRERDQSLPEPHYICGSRHAWYLALFDPAVPKHRYWVNLLPEPTLSALFENVEFDPMEFAEELGALGYPPESFDRPLSFEERVRVLEALSRRESAAERFKKRREARLERTLAYFEQEGVFRHQRIALVDIGWSGSMLDSFRELLGRFRGPVPEVTGLYFGLHQNPGPDRMSYFLHPTSWPDWLTAFPSVVEMLAPADHGQTVDYARRSDRVEPVYAEDRVAPPEQIEAFHNGALEYVRRALEANVTPPCCRRLLWTFIAEPTGEQVGRWKDFQFWTWQKPTDVAPPLIRTLSLRELFVRSLSIFRRVDAWPWATASIRRSFPRTPAFLLGLLVHKMQLDRYVLGVSTRVLHRYTHVIATWYLRLTRKRKS